MKKIFVFFVTALLVAFSVNTHAVEVDLLGGVNIHGFISQGYMKSQDNNYLANDSSDGTFAFNEIGINFSKQLTDQLRIGLQLFSHDLGAIGNNDIILDWAFADYRWKDWLGLRAGKIKAPLGLYNETRDMDMLRTSILLPQSIYDENQRETYSSIIGAGLYGNIPVQHIGGISYYLLVGTNNISGDEDNGLVRQINSYPQFKVSGDPESDEIYVGALEWRPPVDGLLLKVTYRKTSVDTPAEATGQGDPPLPEGTPVTFHVASSKQVVYSVEYTWNDLVLAAEWSNNRVDPALIFETLGLTYPEGLRKIRGQYVSASYRFNDWFEAGLYYSESYPDADDKDGDDQVASGMFARKIQAWQKDAALSLRFDINEYWVAKVEGHLMDGVAACLPMDNDIDDLEEDWYLFAAKLTFSF